MRDNEPAALDNSTGLRKTVSHALDQGMSIMLRAHSYGAAGAGLNPLEF